MQTAGTPSTPADSASFARGTALPMAPLAVTTWRRLLLEPRVRPGFGRLEAVVLLLYSTILAITVPFHEPWFDEAQAWLLARDSTLAELFLRRLHYEESPGLWHLVLWVANRLHLPYASMNWIAAIFAACGVFVLLRYSPFPPVFRALLPFTFFLQYQYAVIARSYTMMPVFVFILCALFLLPKPRPLLFAIAASLLANLSLFAFLFSGGLTLLYLPRLWAGRSRSPRSRLILPAAIYLASCLIAFYTALPAPDVVAPTGTTQYFNGNKHPWMNRILPPTAPPAAGLPPPLTPAEDHGRLVPVLGGLAHDPFLYTRGNALQRLLVRATQRPNGTYQQQTWAHRLASPLRAVSAVLYAISASNLLAIAFLISALVWLGTRRALRFLLPLLLMFLFAAETWIYDHHSGLFFLALLAAFWLAWPDPNHPHRRPSSIYLNAFMGLFLIVVLQQVGWSAVCITRDILRPYDPGVATAKYLRQNAPGKLILAYTFDTVSITPYLAPQSFFNQHHSYWLWSANDPVRDTLPIDFASHPDIVVAGELRYGDQWLENQVATIHPPGSLLPALNPDYLALQHFHERTRFCGQKFIRFGISSSYCNIIFVPDPAPLRP